MTLQSSDIRDGSEHVGQVSRCLMVKTLAYINADFEADSLLDRQPVQLVTNVIRNVIEFEFLHDQSGSGTQNGLQLVQ